MKVLNVNSSLDLINGGGGVERTIKMSANLVKQNVECTILATDYNFKDEFRSKLKGINLVIIPCLIKRYFWPKLSLKVIKEVIKNHDIILLMAHWSILSAIVFVIARKLNKPYVVCPVGTLSIFGKSKFFKIIYNYVIGRRIISKADAYIAVNQAEASQLISSGVDPHKVFIIPNGVDEDELGESDDAAFRNKYGLGDRPFVLFLGRLNLIKGPDLLLKAFCSIMARVEPDQLVFGGPDSGMLAELQSLVYRYGAEDRVHFLGYLGDADKSRAFHAAALVAIPSRQEAMSIVVLEAGITGTPVLITENCGFDEIAQIGGGMVVPSTPEGIADGLLALLGDVQGLKRKGENLRKYTADNFSWNSIILKYINLYQKLLTNTGHSQVKGAKAE